MNYFWINLLNLYYIFTLINAQHSCNLDDYDYNLSGPIISKIPKITNITFDNGNNIAQVTFDKRDIKSDDENLKINQILFLNFPSYSFKMSYCTLRNIVGANFSNFLTISQRTIDTYMYLIFNNSYNYWNSPILSTEISKNTLEYSLNRSNFTLKNVEFYEYGKFSITCNNCLGEIEDDFSYTNISLDSNVTLQFASTLYCFVYIFKENLQNKFTKILSFNNFVVNAVANHYELPRIIFISNQKFELIFDFSTKTKEHRKQLQYKLYFRCLDQWCLNDNDLTYTFVPQKFGFRTINVITLNELLPFTNYEVFVNAKLFDCDAFNDDFKQSLGKYKTLAGKPKNVENLSYYYRNLTHLWIMFQDPYPPQGEIKQYSISDNFSQNSYSKSYFTDCKNRTNFNCGIISFINMSKILKVGIVHNGDTGYQGDLAEIDVNILDFKYNKSFMEDVNVTFTNDTDKVLLKFVQPYLQSGPFEFSLTVSNNTKKNIPLVIFQHNYTELLQAYNNFSITLKATNKYEELTKIFNVQIKQIHIQPYQIDLIETCNINSSCVIDVKVSSQIDGKVERVISSANKSSLDPCLLLSNYSTNNKFEDTLRTNSFRISTNESLLNMNSYLLVETIANSSNNFCSFNRLRDKTSLSTDLTNLIISRVFGTLAGIGIFVIIAILAFRCRKEKVHLKTDNLSLERIQLLQNSSKSFDTNFFQALKHYDEIPTEFINKSTEKAADPSNKSLNRYNNILPYDDSIVLLSNNKYINANFVDGNAYIATQAPLKNTIDNFWQMISEHNVTTIVMLTNLMHDTKIQSEKYWPDLHKTILRENYSVSTKERKYFLDFTVLTIELSYLDKKTVIEHFQYTAWSSSNLIPLYEESYLKLLCHVKSKKSPMVVHCNSGCGRTGTFILCSILMKAFDNQQEVDSAKALKQIRQCRPLLVKHKSQFVFANSILFNYMFTQQFLISKKANSIARNYNDLLPKLKTNLKQGRNFYPVKNQQQSRLLQRLSVTDEDFQGYLIPNQTKCYQYLNFVKVPCYRSKDKFIVTEQPKHEYVFVDFWRLVKEKEITTVIVLNEFDLNTPPLLYPQQVDELLDIDSRIGCIQTTNLKESNCLIDYTLRIGTDKGVVQLIRLKNWSSPNQLPNCKKDLVQIYETIWNFSSAKILVCCRDGLIASGLFVALCYTLEQINNEQVCNIFEALKKIKENRCEFVESNTQMLFLFESAQMYIEQFNHYSVAY